MIKSAEWVGLTVGLVGLVVSIGGFWIAIYQIRKTRTAASAAAAAADRTARALVQNHLLFLIPELTRLVADTETAVSAAESARAV